ncbi:MAG TPA: hypothetical protein VFS21_36090 [Roseiflexaceae bacterium]|nr:hypothetical protein [Roseiflexaceae bacterium]
MEPRTIFIFERVSPAHITPEDLQHIRSYSANQHYVIVCTESQPNSWHLAPAVQQLLWRELQPDGLFSPADLAEAFIERLLDREHLLPQSLRLQDLAPDKPLCEQLTPLQIVRRLGTLSHIDWFIIFLTRTTAPLNDAVLQAIIEQARRSDRLPPEEAFRLWYRALDQRQQLLALNVGLLEAMHDGQFFAATEMLIDQVWRKRDPQLRAFDYDDLLALSPFCTLFPTANSEYIVQVRQPGTSEKLRERQILLQEAWISHRRQVLAALPSLVQLAQNSVERPRPSLDLYGSWGHRMRLRRAISDTLGEIGMLAVDAVQPALIALAADNTETVQRVAAHALGQWYQAGQAELMFQTIDRWRNSQQSTELFETALDTRKQQNQQDAQSYMAATIALVLEYAAQHDAPNQLNHRLIELFTWLANNQSPFVRKRFNDRSLPSLVRRHLAQLKPTLRSMLSNRVLIEPIAESFALAYVEKPQEILGLLDEWYEDANRLGLLQSDLSNVSLREKVLATVIRTYGAIDYSESTGPLTLDQAFGRLMAILKAESNTFVQTEVVLAVGSLAEQHFGRVEQQLHDLVRHVPVHARARVVERLFLVFQTQRLALPEGQALVSVGGLDYPIWLSRSRSLTVVEQAMLRWLQDTNNQPAQRIAFWALTEFVRRLEGPIEQQAAPLRETYKRELVFGPALAPAAAAPTAIATPAPVRVPLIVSLLTPSSHRQIIQNILPEVLERRQVDKAATQSTISFLNASPERPVQIIGHRLIWALGWIDGGCIPRLGVLLLILLFGCSGLQLLVAFVGS